MKRSVDAEFWIRDVVYLKVRDEKLTGMITGVQFRNVSNDPLYGVTWGTGNETWHCGFELSTTYLPEWERNSGDNNHELGRATP